MDNEIVEILVVMALTTTKYLSGIIAGLYNEWSFPVFYLTTVMGGMIGVIAYDLLLLEVLAAYRKWKGIDATRPRVNKKTRRLVMIRKKLGLVGIVILTPVFLQVPIGTILAGSIEPSTRKVALYMFVCFSLYSIVFYALYHYLGFSPRIIFESLQFWK